MTEAEKNNAKYIADRAQRLSIQRKRERGERLLPEDEEFLSNESGIQVPSALSARNILEVRAKVLEIEEKLNAKKFHPLTWIQGFLQWRTPDGELQMVALRNYDPDGVRKEIQKNGARGYSLEAYAIELPDSLIE